MLYQGTAGGGSILQGKRLAVMLNSAMGVVARDAGEGVFVDLDTIPEDAISLQDGLRYLLSPRGDCCAACLRRKPRRRTCCCGRRRASRAPVAQLPRAPKLLRAALRLGSL